jgi:hypothetical protein
MAGRLRSEMPATIGDDVNLPDAIAEDPSANRQQLPMWA